MYEISIIFCAFLHLLFTQFNFFLQCMQPLFCYSDNNSTVVLLAVNPCIYVLRYILGTRHAFSIESWSVCTRQYPYLHYTIIQIDNRQLLVRIVAVARSCTIAE